MGLAHVLFVAVLLYNFNLTSIRSPDHKATDLFPFGAGSTPQQCLLAKTSGRSLGWGMAVN